LIRIGVGIIGFLTCVILVFAAASFLFGYNPEIGPTAIWIVFWTVVAFSLIATGVGQTVVRRRSRNHH
jgi:membrane protein implicated in regulation of membrane protease activity